MNCDINNSYKIEKFKCDRNDEKYCVITKNNLFYNQMLKYLNRLNCYIFTENIDYSKYKNVIDLLYNYLLKRRNFIKDIYLWKQLHSRYVDTYNIDNYELSIGNINVYKTTKHNYAVAPFINEMLKNKKIDLLIHFDTHSDMNPLEKYTNVDKIFNNIILKNEVKSNIENLEKEIWDIGMPVTGFIGFWNKLNKNNKLKILWNVPAWIPKLTKEPIEDEIDTLFSSRNIYLTEDKRSNCLTYTKNKTKNTISSFHLKRLKFKNKTNWKEVLKYIDNSTFILDIDLDYFVSNGIKYTSNYLDEYDDIASHYRTTTDSKVLHDSPRDPFSEDTIFNKHNKKINKEINEIRKRMKYFLQGIKYLKNNNKIPVSIIMCDSTSAPASIYKKYHTHYNEYVPHEYALWIHKTILFGLNKIYLT